MTEVSKTQKEFEKRYSERQDDLINEINNLREDIERKVESEVGDKVRVDEVQDALRRLTDSFKVKLETLYSLEVIIMAEVYRI